MTARSPSTAGSHPPAAKAGARAAAAEAARVKARRQRQVRVLLVAVVAIVVAVGAFALWFWPAGGPKPETARAGLSSVSGRGAERLPPWPAPSDVPARAEAAGLPLGPMGMAEHYHVHLDVLVDGESVVVPANLGVDPSSGQMSYLHTHTPDGVVHIEAGRSGQPFTLGQLFTEWDVRLSATQVGGLKATGGKTLTLYVNGKQVPGDPARLRLRPHQQITMVYGSAGQRVDVPERYPFAPGE